MGLAASDGRERPGVGREIFALPAHGVREQRLCLSRGARLISASKQRVDPLDTRAVRGEIEHGREQEGDHPRALSSANQRRKSSPLLRARTSSTWSVSAASQNGSSSIATAQRTSRS